MPCTKSVQVDRNKPNIPANIFETWQASNKFPRLRKFARDLWPLQRGGEVRETWHNTLFPVNTVTALIWQRRPNRDRDRQCVGVGTVIDYSHLVIGLDSSPYSGDYGSKLHMKFNGQCTAKHIFTCSRRLDNQNCCRCVHQLFFCSLPKIVCYSEAERKEKG